MRVKPDVMDAPPVFDSKIDRFKYWFTNVFWFHYRLHTIGIIIASVFLFSMIHSIATKRDPDLVVVVAAAYEFDLGYAMELREELEGLVNEMTGRDNAVVEFVALNLSGATEVGVASIQLLSVHLVRQDTLLFILGADVINNMLEGDESFMSLEPYGYGGRRLLDASRAPRITRLNFYQGAELYAGLLDRESATDLTVGLSAAALGYLLEE